MYNLGLDTTTREEFETALVSSHRVRITMNVLDRNEDIIVGLRPELISGSIQVDSDADVKRSLSAVFLDPAHKLAFDSANPTDAALYADNFLAVKYGVYLPDSDQWVDVPVFWGTITGFARNGPEVSIEAQGKEALALDPHLVVAGYTLPRGMSVKTAIQNVMGRIGEERFALNMVTGSLGNARAITPGEAPWRVCAGGARDANGGAKPALMSKANGNLLLFYDGAGRLTAKNRNANTVWTFTDAQLTGHPGFKYDVLSFRNHAEVKGGVRKGSKHHARGEYSLPAGHPLSPTALARNGKRRFMAIFAENDNLKTDAACRDKARKLVEAVAFEGIEASFECLPIPHLEESDVVTLQTDKYALTFRVRQFTIPLTVDSPMSIGFNQRTKLPQRRRRRR